MTERGWIDLGEHYYEQRDRERTSPVSSENLVSSEKATALGISSSISVEIFQERVKAFEEFKLNGVEVCGAHLIPLILFMELTKFD